MQSKKEMHVFCSITPKLPYKNILDRVHGKAFSAKFPTTFRTTSAKRRGVKEILKSYSLALSKWWIIYTSRGSWADKNQQPLFVFIFFFRAKVVAANKRREGRARSATKTNKTVTINLRLRLQQHPCSRNVNILNWTSSSWAREGITLKWWRWWKFRIVYPLAWVEVFFFKKRESDLLAAYCFNSGFLVYRMFYKLYPQGM